MFDFLDLIADYISHLTFEKFFKVFWYFIIFELLRFFVLYPIVLIIWRIKLFLRREKAAKERIKLFSDNPLVSIIIPGKNEGENFYQLAVSLQAQTYQNFEIILIDDGSTDDSKQIGQSLLKAGIIQHFFSNEVRGGKASAANLGLRFAKGEFIVHLDADCTYDSDALEQILLPFYRDEKIAGVGGNVLVRNSEVSLATIMQAIEYANSISIARIITSELGILRIISGAFGAFRRDAISRIHGWDIGPGLDGDISVKLRKLGFKIVFNPFAVCKTNVPTSFGKLFRQRMRWGKSLVRFRLRKHADVFLPGPNFNWPNFISFSENIFYNIILDIHWLVYFITVTAKFNDDVLFIVTINMMMYCTASISKFFIFRIFRSRSDIALWKKLPYVILMPLYTTFFLRIIRSIAYLREWFLKSSYDDNWNPQKTSKHAKSLGI